jgi:hypothetical protein
VYGFGEPSGQTPDLGLLPVGVDYFAWGFGDADPAILSGEIDWGFGDPETLADDHVLWVSASELPDDGGEIVVLIAPWPEIGPYRIKCIQSHTGQQFPQASSPLPYCNSPVPGGGGDCFTNIIDEVIGGVVFPTPGTTLRFVLPILPPGIYDVEITAPDGLSAIRLSRAMSIVWRNRAVQVHMIRNRWPAIFEAGQRSTRYETLLGFDPESEEEA